MPRFGSRIWVFGAMTLLLTVRLVVELAPDLHRFAVEQPWASAGYVAVVVTASAVGAYTGVRNGLLVGPRRRPFGDGSSEAMVA